MTLADPGNRPQRTAVVESRPSLLLIDDEAGIVEMLTIVFEKEGYRVRSARGCVEGIEKLEAQIPDLILTDLKMPDGTGFDVLKRCLELAPATPVVMITAFTSTKTAIEALKAGAYDYISKPFDVTSSSTSSGARSRGNGCPRRTSR